jgi:phosphoribosylformylglycinamidine synthase
LATIHNTVAGRPPRVDFELERTVQSVCRDGIRSGWVYSAHDTAEGGLTVALAECCLSGNLGAEVNLGISADHDTRFDEVLFGEGGARILVSVGVENQEKWESYLQEHLGENWQKLGVVANLETGLMVSTTDKQELIKISIKDMSNVYDQAIAQRLALYANT